jgi:hypothetical protein
MNVPRLLLLLCVAIVLMNVFFSSCKEKTGYTIVSTVSDSASQIIIAKDELNLNYELDQAVNEVLLATNISRTASGDSSFTVVGNALFTTIKSAIIDTSHLLDSAKISITYAGINADLTKARTGNISIKFAKDSSGKVIPWKTQGSIATLTFSQYEVIVQATNKSLWMNGTGTITNVTGGILRNATNLFLPHGDSLIDRINLHIDFTYNDNTNIITTYAWNINQHRSFVLNDSTIISSISGDTTMNGFSNISTAGTTRSGSNFYTGITAPLVQKINSLYLLTNPLSGEENIHGITQPIDVVYGVDLSGNYTTTNPYGYKITWINNGGQAQVVVSY